MEERKPLFISLTLYIPLLVRVTVVLVGNDGRAIHSFPSCHIHRELGRNVGYDETVFPSLEFEKLDTSLIVIQSGAHKTSARAGARNMNHRSGSRVANEVDARAEVGTHSVVVCEDYGQLEG